MSVTGLSPSISAAVDSPIEMAVLETLAYSDIFDYPLSLEELMRYLPIPADRDALKNQIAAIPSVARDDSTGFYHLAGRGNIIAVRRAREAASRSSFNRALAYGKILGQFPFARMAAMTGSLAMLNLSANADMDFMLVTAPNRLWIARALAVTFGRLMRLTGDRICVNLLVSENSLEWSRHDLYSAREMGQMIPISGMTVYRRLRESNPWVASFLPNAGSAPGHSPDTPRQSGSRLQRFLELLLPETLAARLDSLLMDFQLRRIIREYGQGLESNFTIDLCQGNFHNHRTRTDDAFQARLVSLGITPREDFEQ